MLTEDEKKELTKTAEGLKKVGENFLDSNLGKAAKYSAYFLGGTIFVGIALRVLAYAKEGFNQFRDKL